MHALIRSLLEHTSLAELELMVEEKKALDRPKTANEDDLMKDYLIKKYLKFRNPLIK